MPTKDNPTKSMDARRKLMAKKKILRGRTGRLEERFKLSLENENYYEAHQTVKVIYDRHVAQGKDEEGWMMLHRGTIELLSKDQWESGTEVALLLVEHLKERKTPVSNDILDKIENIFCLYKCIKDHDRIAHPQVLKLTLCQTLNEKSSEELARLHTVQVNRDMFMKSALKWSSLIDEKLKYGHTRLHKLLALAYFEEGEFERARKHFLYADLPEEFGKALAIIAEDNSSGTNKHLEAEMFITQAVLQLLVLGNRECAYKTYLQYCRQHSLLKPFMPPPFRNGPLLNFTWFLILSIDIGNPEVFTCLCNCYQPVLRWDPFYTEYLMKIGSNYFNITTNRTSDMMGMLGGADINSLISSLTGGINMPYALDDMDLMETAEGLD